MRTHRAKSGYLPAEYIPHTFWLVTPLPFLRRFIVGAAIEKNFFWFYFFVSPIRFLLVFYFFYFFLIFVWILVSTLFFRLSYLIISTRLKFVILYSILFFRLSVVLTRIQVSLNIYSFAILVFTSDFRLASISTCFSIVYSTLYLFNSLSLLLVINKHLCLW